MYKIFRKIHLWLAVPFGLIMIVICATGLILLLEPEHVAGSGRPEFFLDVMRLHRWLLDAPATKGAMSAGKMVVALTTVAMVLVLISGIVLWWIRSRRNVARNLYIDFGNGFRRMCYSLHTAGGMYVVIFLLVMALTGLTWSFGWYRAGFNTLFGIERGSHIVYLIHTGAFGGLITKIIWFVSVFIGLTLPITGYYIWIDKMLAKKR